MKTITGTAELNYTKTDGNKATETMPVTYPEFETAQDVREYLGPAETDGLDSSKLVAGKLLDWLNYGANLRARAIARGILQERVEGPTKTFNKQVEALIKQRAVSGKPITDAQARKMVAYMNDMEAPEIVIEPETPPEAPATEAPAEAPATA